MCWVRTGCSLWSIIYQFICLLVSLYRVPPLPPLSLKRMRMVFQPFTTQLNEETLRYFKNYCPQCLHNKTVRISIPKCQQWTLSLDVLKKKKNRTFYVSFVLWLLRQRPYFLLVKYLTTKYNHSICFCLQVWNVRWLKNIGDYSRKTTIALHRLDPISSPAFVEWFIGWEDISRFWLCDSLSLPNLLSFS